jgi:hypothetical protein
MRTIHANAPDYLAKLAFGANLAQGPSPEIDLFGGFWVSHGPLAGKMPARAGGTPALPRNIDKMRSFSAGFLGFAIGVIAQRSVRVRAARFGSDHPQGRQVSSLKGQCA